MTNGYFSGETQILLPDGTYKNISKISPGDTIVNMNNEPTKVVNIHQLFSQNMMEIKYKNWYAPFRCTGDTQLLVTINIPAGKNEPEMVEQKWVAANDLQPEMNVNTDGNIYNLSFPLDFKNTELIPTFELGFVFGLYSGYGYINDNTLTFKFGPNEDLVDQLVKLLNDLFDAKSNVVKNDSFYLVNTNDINIIKIFTEFGSKIDRTIPQKYRVTNSEYVKGLFEGLVEYDEGNSVVRYVAVSTKMCEDFVWICTLLGLTFEHETINVDIPEFCIYNLLVRENDSDKNLHVNKNANAMRDCWNLEVSCPTGSFIASGLVVKGFAHV